MRCRRAADDAGGVAAEFAVALPAVALVLGACLAAIGAGAQQVRLQDAAADAARSLGRGETAAVVASRADRVAGATVTSRYAGELVCVRLIAPAPGVLSVVGLELAAESCALGGGR